MNAGARWIALNAAIAGVYYVLGRFGLLLALPPGYASAIWPAAGFAFAVALVWGAGRVWCGIFLGALTTNLMVQPAMGVSALVLGTATGATLQAVVGSIWLRRRNPEIALDRPDRVLRFSLIGALSCLIAASLGNIALYLAGVNTLAQTPQSFVTWWLGDAFGVQIFAPLSLLLIAPNAVWKRQRIAVGMPLLLAFLLCGLIHYFVRDAEERQLTRSVVTATAPLMNEMRSLERIYSQALLQLSASYEQQATLPGPEFVRIAEKIHPGLPAFRAMSWAPVLDAAGQAKFPAMALAAGAGTVAIRRPPGFAASADGLAAPVLWIYPRTGNENAVGIDLLGEPVRAEALRRSLVTGLLSVTNPVRLAQDHRGRGGVLVMAPVQNRSGVGVFSAVLDLGLIDNALDRIPDAVWELREMTARGEVTVLQSGPEPLPHFGSDTQLDRRGVQVQQLVRLGDRQWRMVVHVPHRALARDAGIAPMLVLSLAFFACGIFANFALVMSSDRERIASEVADKTQALREEVAEHARAETALRENRSFLTSLIENSGALIFAKNRAGVYQLVNRKWEEVTGLARERVIGKTDADLFPPEVAAQFRRNDLAVMEAGELQESDEHLDAPELPGGHRYFLSIKFPVRSALDEITGMCAITTEITERKQHEAALERARDAAEAANLAKSQFLATMSHEIRTPMNGILGMAQLLMMDGLAEDERKEFVRTILGSGKSLLTILNDILDLSKIEAGKMSLSLSPFDPVELLHETAALFGETAQKKGMSLTVLTPQEGARFIGDPIRLRQMLSNYVGNAIKFSERGAIALSVDAVGEQPELLEFAVSDQGIGIPEDKLSALFEPFVQVDSSATRRFGGTGLGLSIVRRLARQMGGDVGVESRENEGSRFWFRVHVDALAATETRHVPRIEHAEERAANARSGWVLVVEDNATNRLVVQTMLTRLGVAVRIAGNGQEALDLLAENRESEPANPPRLILMDCQMPVLDGFATTIAIRRRETELGLPRQRIVALTAGAFEDDHQRCLDVGMDDFLTKPLAFDDLARVVETALA